MIRFTWEKRIERARKLAVDYPFAAELLQFYEQIASFQKDLYAHIRSASGGRMEDRIGGSLRDELDLTLLLPKFPPFLSLVEQVAPAVLAQQASELGVQDHDSWMNLLAAYWTVNGQEEAMQNPSIFIARAFLQPYAEYLADHTRWPSLDTRPPICPLCGGKPQVGVLRPEGDGAKRSLVCSTCLNEWDYRRIICPACGEEGVDKLPVYTASQFEYMRVDGCDSCKTFLITVDLTKNGHAIPEVDELAGIPLGLWAQENHYRKLQPNLLGM